MKKFLSKILIYSLPLIVLFLYFTNNASAYTDEGVVVWASGSNVMARTYSDVTGVLGSPQTIITGVSAKFITIKSSPTKKEFVMGIQDTSGVLRAYHSSDGISWVQDWNVSIGDSNTARFDVAYEQTSGRAIIAYRGRILTSRTTFYYRIWTGSAWGAQTEMRSTVAAYNRNISALKLASRPGSNQIGMVYTDEGYYSVAVFWSGTAWTFASAAITTNGTRYNGFTGVYPPLNNISVAFESTSGDMLAVAGVNSSTERLRYITRSAAGTWSASTIFNTISGFGDYSKLVPSPTTNEISLTTCLMEPSAAPATYACDFVLWNGTSFGSVTSDSATGVIIDGDMPIDVFWVSNSTDRIAVAVYDNNTNGLDWSTSLNGGNYIPQTSDQGNPIITVNEGQIFAEKISGISTDGLILVSDENNNVYLKKGIINGQSIEWDSTFQGVLPEVTQGAYPVTSSNFGRIALALQSAPPLLVISTTSATTRRVITSGDTAYVAGTDCSSKTDCLGFELSARGKSAISVSRIMINNSGTINLADTSGWEIGIDDDGNPNNGVDRTVTGSVSGNNITFNISPTLTINSGQKVYIFPKAIFSSGTNYPDAGETIILKIESISDIDSTATLTPDEYILGTPSVLGIIAPKLIGYDNISESTLSNTGVSCTDCGTRIGNGTFAQIVEINGHGFGVSTGTISISGGATNILPSASIVSWTASKIRVLFDTDIVGCRDSDFGINYGGVNALTINSGTQNSNGLDFYLFPQIISFSSSYGVNSNVAKEYSTDDTDGVINLTGTRFGSSIGSGDVLILGCSETTCVSPTDSARVTLQTNSSITVRVPTSTPDNLYTGNLTYTRSYPSASSSRAIYKNQISIRPRITSISPTSASPGNTVTILGDHLCPTGGVCPSGSPGVDSDLNIAPQFSTDNKVVIGGTQANYFGSWSHNTITTKAPTGSIMGSTTLTVTAGTYAAGSKNISISITAIPGMTRNIKTFSGNNTSTLLPVGGYTSTSSITFGALLSATTSGNSQLRMNVEVAPIGTSFSCGSGACVTSINGPWYLSTSDYTEVDCSIGSNNCATTSVFGGNAYHYRVRTELLIAGSTYYGSWVSFPDTGVNLESDPDFWIDNDNPVIIGLSHNTPGTNSVTITWDTNEKTDSLVQINKTGIFTDDCSSSNGCNGASSTLTLVHSTTIKNLSSNTIYFYRVRGKDSAGNIVWSSVMQFKTLAVEKPSKTVFFHAISVGNIISESTGTTTSFVINIPEQNAEFTSVFVDLRGIYSTQGTLSKAGVTVKINGEPSVSYNLPGGSVMKSPWRIFHKVKNLNIQPINNTITISAGADTEIRGVSGDVIVSYLYTP